jgi:serine/threonine protein kinase
VIWLLPFGLSGRVGSVVTDSTQHHTGGPPSPGPGGWQQPPDIVGSVLAERYKVISILGDGGMGKVYLGEHITLRKKVAIKVLKQEFCHDRTNVERFLQEARAASMVRHENIVDIMDFGQVPGGSVFFVMELLEGRDLSQLLKDIGRLPWLRTRNILLQVVRALRAAHENGIIHRDMKPGNVFLTNRASAMDYVKVLDFGIAKVEDQSTQGLTRTGAVFGTAGYMAPEQACGDPVDARTDVYAVGCMMFELLTGRLPFPGNNFMRVLTQHMNEPPPSPREVAPDADISDEVETIILTSLSKKASDRFPDMSALEKAIAQANGEVATVPPSNRPRTNKGTVVLDEGPSPFAGMTPGTRPPTPTLPSGNTNPDATMMLDGMGGSMMGGANAGATMMLDGMGGSALDGSGSTVMLDSASAELLRKPLHQTSGPVVAAHVDDDPDAAAAKKKKLYMALGGGAVLLVLILILAIAFGGDKGDDEVASADTPSEKADPPVDDPPAETGAVVADTGAVAADTGAVAADTGAVAADTGAVEADTGAVAADTGAVAADTGEPSDDGDLIVEDPDPDPVPGIKKTTEIKDELSDKDISKGLSRIQSKVSKCKSSGGLPGMKIKVSLSISNGKVTSASARPPNTTTAVGKCVAEAVKSAKFTKAKATKITEQTLTL